MWPLLLKGSCNPKFDLHLFYYVWIRLLIRALLINGMVLIQITPWGEGYNECQLI